MSLIRNFEQKMAGIMEGPGHQTTAPISFKKLAKRLAKEMDRETLIIEGVDTAPPLYTILVGPQDNAVMSRHYYELVPELEDFLVAHAGNKKLIFEERPLVRFIVDPALKTGKFDVIVENVAPIILAQLKREEQAFLSGKPLPRPARGYRAQGAQPQGGPGIIPYQDSPSVELSQPMAPYQQQLDAVSAFEPAAPVAAAAPVFEPQPDELYVEPQEGAVSVGAQGAIAASAGLENILVSEGETVMGEMGAYELIEQSPHDPASVLGAHLIIREDGSKHPLRETGTSIGRDEYMADIVLSDLNVSRKHAQIARDENGWHIADLHSTNGTYVNGQEIVTRKLVDGDRITMGVTELIFKED